MQPARVSPDVRALTLVSFTYLSTPRPHRPMNGHRHVLRLALLLCTPTLMNAQAATCTLTGPAAVRGFAADACQKGTDIFAFVMPQFAQALSGGGAILGTANTLGGLGKFSLNVRVSAVEGRVPDIDALRLNATGVQATQLATKESPVPAPAVDVGVGIFKGFRAGRTQLFSLDGMVNIAYLPDVDVEELKLVVPGERFKFGYGGRLGLTRDGKLVPAISASYIRRELPTSDISADFEGGTGGTDRIALSGFSVTTEAMRLSISKKMAFLEIGGGVGRDTYETQLNISATIDEGGNTGTASTTFAQQLKRDIVYVSAAFNLPLLKLAAEVGQATGGAAVRTVNSFVDGGEGAARRFASVGVRVSF